MTRDDLPDNWQDLLAGYALDNLSPEEVERLERLLAQRPELKAELLAYEKTWEQLPVALPHQNPPAYLEAQLLAAAQRSQQVDPTQMHLQVAPSPRLGQRRWFIISWAIAAATLLVLGIDNWQLRQNLVARKIQLRDAEITIETLQQDIENARIVFATLRQPTSQVHQMEGTNRLKDVSGRLIVVPGHSEVALVADNMPLLPADQIYRLWATTDDRSDPLYCGQFQANETGAMQWVVPESLCVTNPAQMLITIEPAASAPRFGNELVMQSPMS